MNCRDCLHFLSSEEANKPRPGLAGYGYCKAAATPLLRARFFSEATASCWLTPPQFRKGKS